ncbi:hypothetical protein PG996_003498 [Apiospora saccharicola]|uniref:Uncharacterized protein n=1 Tax=Apiospora saccharicola TaxID=335842 RepID=A0ABR1W5A0_9PEZI
MARTFDGPKAYHAHQEDSTVQCSPEYIAPAVMQPMASVIPAIVTSIQKNPLLCGSVKSSGDRALVAKGAGSLVPQILAQTLDEVLSRTYMCAGDCTGVAEMRAYLGEGAARLLLAMTLDVALVDCCRAAQRVDDLNNVEKRAPVKCELTQRDHTSGWTLSLSLVQCREDPDYMRLCVDKGQSTLTQSAWHHEVQRRSFPDDSLWYNVWNGPSRQTYFISLGKVDQRWFTNSHACEAWSDIVKETLCVYLGTYQQFDLAEYDSADVAAPSHGLNMVASRFEKRLHIDSTDPTNLTNSEDPEKQAYAFMMYQAGAAGRYQVNESAISLVRKRLLTYRLRAIVREPDWVLRHKTDALPVLPKDLRKGTGVQAAENDKPGTYRPG